MINAHAKFDVAGHLLSALVPARDLDAARRQTFPAVEVGVDAVDVVAVTPRYPSNRIAAIGR